MDARYAVSIDHWFASSSQKPACVFEPGTPEDVSIAVRVMLVKQRSQYPCLIQTVSNRHGFHIVPILTTPQQIGIIAQSQTPFALKSGGHASNPGQSSTTGVHFSFARMKQVILSEDKSTVELGMGLVREMATKRFQPTKLTELPRYDDRLGQTRTKNWISLASTSLAGECPGPASAA